MRPGLMGRHGSTGLILKLKWRPVKNFRGWPFLLLQSEIMGRNYRADRFSSPGPDGIYMALLMISACHGRRLRTGDIMRSCSGDSGGTGLPGLRFEYVSGSGNSVNVDFRTGEPLRSLPRNPDPFRNNRYRISPMLAWQPTEFSRFRLQYNYDHNSELVPGFSQRGYCSVWLGSQSFMLWAPTQPTNTNCQRPQKEYNRHARKEHLYAKQALM